MTPLRNMVLEELQRRNYSQNTTKIYLRTIWEFARYFHRSPDELGPEHIREFQAHLFSVRKLAANTVAQRTAALRFLFVKTLKRTYMLEHIPFPKTPLRLPDHPQPGGSHAADRGSPQPAASHDPDDPVLHRNAPRGTGRN